MPVRSDSPILAQYMVPGMTFGPRFVDPYKPRYRFKFPDEQLDAPPSEMPRDVSTPLDQYRMPALPAPAPVEIEPLRADGGSAPRGRLDALYGNPRNYVGGKLPPPPSTVHPFLRAVVEGLLLGSMAVRPAGMPPRFAAPRLPRAEPMPMYRLNTETWSYDPIAPASTPAHVPSPYYANIPPTPPPNRLIGRSGNIIDNPAGNAPPRGPTQEQRDLYALRPNVRESGRNYDPGDWQSYWDALYRFDDLQPPPRNRMHAAGGAVPARMVPPGWTDNDVNLHEMVIPPERLMRPRPQAQDEHGNSMPPRPPYDRYPWWSWRSVQPMAGTPVEPLDLPGRLRRMLTPE